MTLAIDPARRQRPGTVRFATRTFAATDADADADAGIRTSFSVGDRIHWCARFRDRPRGVRVELITVQLSDAGWERVVSGHELWLSHPDVPGYTGWLGPGAYDGAGRYLLRVVRGGTVLAEGEFELLPPPQNDRVH